MAGRLVLVLGGQLGRGGAAFDGFDREGIEVDYTQLETRPMAGAPRGLAGALRASLARAAGIPLEIRPDRHFFATRDEFAGHARGRTQLRLKYFYRTLRKKFGVLMDGGEPAGGRWNYDTQNRGAFPKAGPDVLPAPARFVPDAVTRGVVDHPGRLANFDWPVTPADARAALDDFLAHRLVNFGRCRISTGPATPR